MSKGNQAKQMSIVMARTDKQTKAKEDENGQPIPVKQIWEGYLIYKNYPFLKLSGVELIKEHTIKNGENKGKKRKQFSVSLGYAKNMSLGWMSFWERGKKEDGTPKKRKANCDDVRFLSLGFPVEGWINETEKSVKMDFSDEMVDVNEAATEYQKLYEFFDDDLSAMLSDAALIDNATKVFPEFTQWMSEKIPSSGVTKELDEKNNAMLAILGLAANEDGATETSETEDSDFDY